MELFPLNMTLFPFSQDVI